MSGATLIELCRSWEYCHSRYYTHWALLFENADVAGKSWRSKCYTHWALSSHENLDMSDATLTKLCRLMTILIRKMLHSQSSIVYENLDLLGATLIEFCRSWKYCHSRYYTHWTLLFENADVADAVRKSWRSRCYTHWALSPHENLDMSDATLTELCRLMRILICQMLHSQSSIVCENLDMLGATLTNFYRLWKYWHVRCYAYWVLSLMRILS
jgi:hypothetical protein